MAVTLRQKVPVLQQIEILSETRVFRNSFKNSLFADDQKENAKSGTISKKGLGLAVQTLSLPCQHRVRRDYGGSII